MDAPVLKTVNLTTRNFALAMRMFMSVSTSKPSQSMLIYGRQRAQKAL